MIATLVQDPAFRLHVLQAHGRAAVVTAHACRHRAVNTFRQRQSPAAKLWRTEDVRAIQNILGFCASRSRFSRALICFFDSPLDSCSVHLPIRPSLTMCLVRRAHTLHHLSVDSVLRSKCSVIRRRLPYRHRGKRANSHLAFRFRDLPCRNSTVRRKDRTCDSSLGRDDRAERPAKQPSRNQSKTPGLERRRPRNRCEKKQNDCEREN